LIEGRYAELPARASSFIGRLSEVEALTQLLRTRRLVTICGLAGMGKTRLAVEVVDRLPGDVAAGVRFVGLSALSDGRLLSNEMAARLGVVERPDEPVATTLARHLDAGQVLLVLDNCEHLVDDCARLVQSLLVNCPDLRVLATSLQPLRVSGEVVWRIPPLSVPVGRGEPGDSDAVRLFEARARLVRPSFTVGPANAAFVGSLCRRLEGIPLAIELAASRMATMSVADVMARLDDRLRLLAADAGEAVPRHRTLHAALDWGHQLLDDRERRLFRRLAVFAGGFELTTAEVVCSGAGLEPGDVSALVLDLAERSLVQLETGRRGPDRYRLLESIRQFAAERLHESGEGFAIRQRHASWYLALAERAEGEERGMDQDGWLTRLETDLDNIRAALEWFRRRDTGAALAMATALSWFWVTRGHFAEGRGWLESALAAAGAHLPGQARGLLGAARVAFWQGDYPAAYWYCEAAVAMFDQPADAVDRCWALTLLGSIFGYQGEYEQGRRRFQEALEIAADDVLRMEALVGLGEMLLQAGDVGGARECLDEVERLTRGPDAPRGRAALLLALAATLEDDGPAALGHAARGLAIFHHLGNRYGAAAVLDTMAAVAVGGDDPVRALRLCGAASALRETTRSQLAPRWRDILHAVVIDPARAAAGERADAAWAAGRAMGFEEAVRYAMEGQTVASEPAADPQPAEEARPAAVAGLTRRELEVAELVAQGLTNRQIAERLVIAERTVEGHVERVRNKLNVRSRTQVAASISRERAWPSA
jgi:predicted ATPase/DNA-binding NarL/FixJ family response regulator